MSPVGDFPPIMTNNPDCPPATERFDASAVTTRLMTKEPAHDKGTKMSTECRQGVQTVPHPPIAIEPVILKTPNNYFRKQVLWKYPFLVNKDSLYDKKENILRDPDEILSTYKRDYVCELGEIELIRSTAQVPLPDLSPKRHPTLNYMPRNRLNVSTEMGVFYSLPEGRWSLNAREKAPPPKEMKPAYKFKAPKWESEYQANINGHATFMRENKVLTRKVIKVRRIPTLPED